MPPERAMPTSLSRISSTPSRFNVSATERRTVADQGCRSGWLSILAAKPMLFAHAESVLAKGDDDQSADKTCGQPFIAVWLRLSSELVAVH